MDKKTIGIIGGMGPLATADLFKKIVLNTKANTDQEHIKILIDNNTDIPDRTSAIIYNDKNPVPQLIKSAVMLWAMGAQLLAMPCNTAHFFYSDVQKNVEIPVLNMIELTCSALSEKGVKKAGLLATEGTIKSGIYQNMFNNFGTELIIPDENEQTAITSLIYEGVKAGKKDYDVTHIKNVMGGMVDRGAETLILGCTELPVAMEMYKLDFVTCDPTLELAKGAIIAANGICV